MPKGYLKKSEKDKLPDSIRVVQLQIESEIEINSTIGEEKSKSKMHFSFVYDESYSSALLPI